MIGMIIHPMALRVLLWLLRVLVLLLVLLLLVVWWLQWANMVGMGMVRGMIGGAGIIIVIVNHIVLNIAKIWRKAGHVLLNHSLFPPTVVTVENGADVITVAIGAGGGEVNGVVIIIPIALTIDIINDEIAIITIAMMAIAIDPATIIPTTNMIWIIII